MDVPIKKSKRKKCSEKKKRKYSETSSSSDSNDHYYKKRKGKKTKRKSTTTSSSSSESENEKKRRKLKRKQKKEAKILKRKEKELRKKNEVQEDEGETSNIPIALMEKSNAMAPMTKAEWEKKQNVIRKVYDEQTGRHRLIKGDGEVIEEIVSRERHLAINRQATKGDADYFQAHLNTNMSKR